MKHSPHVSPEQVKEWWGTFNEACRHHDVRIPSGDQWQPVAPLVWEGSEFVRQWMCDHPAGFAHLIEEGTLFRSLSRADCYFQYRQLLKQVRTIAQLKEKAKYFRCQMLLRIIWRDIAGVSTLSETLQETSWCAEAIIDLTNKLLFRWQSKRMTPPPSDHGRPSYLIVIAVGKLGGMALNISSDVDLVFCYMAVEADALVTAHGGDDGDADEALQASKDAVHRFYQILARTLIDVLQQPTEAGCVYRVDMRLRPFGASGDLVVRSDWLSDYYAQHAREWERYAMMKGRCISGEPRAVKYIEKMIMRFVYKSYLDYATIESLRQLHTMWRNESYKRHMQHNIKTGVGGIRELEFIVQHIQLMRGGQEPRLRQYDWRYALHHIEDEHLLPKRTVHDLEHAYDFLRQLENRLQAYQDMQTHDLPKDAMKRGRIASALGYESWDVLASQVADWRKQVHHYFQALVLVVNDGIGPQDIYWLRMVERFLSGQLTSNAMVSALHDLHFEQADPLVEMLYRLRQTDAWRQMDRHRQQDFVKLLTAALVKASAYPAPTAVMCAMASLLSVVLERHAYLVLLSEHASTLDDLLRFCHEGVWLVDQIMSYPVLLGELIDQNRLQDSVDLMSLRRQLRQWLQASVGVDNTEKMRVVQHFKKIHTFRTAALDVREVLSIAEVSNRLSYLAEAILEHVQRLAWRHLVARHGRPPGCQRSSRFLIVAYGKLGGFELGYVSDLDVVFLYDPGSEGGSGMTDGAEPIAESVFYTRLGRLILQYMSHQTLGGPLYALDVRLRPMGESGLLVNSLNAFRQYQLQQAWPWEHQAMVRARAVVGPTDLRAAFYDVRQAVLTMPRDPQVLWDAVEGMRAKLRSVNQQLPSDVIDLKRSRGCVMDIEFIVQYMVLAHAQSMPTLMHYSDNLRLLGVMGRLGLLSAAESQCLQAAYLGYRLSMHQLDLRAVPSHTVSSTKFRAFREAVQRVWQRLAAHHH